MRRRRFLEATAAAGLAAGLSRTATAAETNPRYLTLEWYRGRRDQDVQRVRDFLGNSTRAAYERAGARPSLLFQVSVGPESPSLLLVSEHASLAALEQLVHKLAGDEKYSSDLAALDEKWDLAYDRRESWLLRGFRTFPGIEAPGASTLFELRMYESRNTRAHLKKVAMFDEGEIDIFRRAGMQPIFFGSTVFGTSMPNLVYMVGFPSIAARTDAWSKFGQDPEWKKMSTAPGNSDRELVSRISNQLLTIIK
jgi:hypothetical protein